MTWALATPLQHTNIRRWLAELAHFLAQATRALTVSSTRRQSRPERHRSIAQREPFVEEAAMAREMFRL
jgi:hypothetical protein